MLQYKISRLRYVKQRLQIVLMNSEQFSLLSKPREHINNQSTLCRTCEGEARYLLSLDIEETAANHNEFMRGLLLLHQLVVIYSHPRLCIVASDH